ncbi:MAG TPA: hypothetical protein VIY49_36030 [Bryobacteraceae bacterium]
MKIRKSERAAGLFPSAILISAVLFSCPVSAQQQDQSGTTEAAKPDAPLKNETQPDQNKSASDNQSNYQNGTSKDRLFFALPNFLTLENAKNVPPLTAGQKFKTITRASFDPVEYFWYGALAGISQWENSEPGYKQGAEGYGKRFGASFADGTIENYFTGAIFPSLLHQDPRFYQTSQGTFWHRAGYAASRIFVTRTDAGGEQFNYSEIFGSAVGAGISTYTYHPRADKNIPNALSVWGSEVGYDMLTIVVKEFWPDIRRKLGHKHQPPAAQAHP